MIDKRLASGRHEVVGRLSLGQGKAKHVVIKDVKGRVIRGSGAIKESEPTLGMLEVIGRTGKLKSIDSTDGETGRAALSKRLVSDLPQNVEAAKRHADRPAATDFQAEADRLGVPLGAAATDEEALARLRVIAADATDIFAASDAALLYLTSQALDGKGRTGVQIIREKGLPGVLAALDHKRFGPRG